MDKNKTNTYHLIQQLQEIVDTNTKVKTHFNKNGQPEFAIFNKYSVSYPINTILDM